MPRDTGYCAIGDVGNVLQDTFQGADPSPVNVKAAIIGESDWMRKQTYRHWYDPDYTPPTDQNTTVEQPTTPRAVTDDVYDVPSSPHAQRGQLVSTREERIYPQTHRGHYTRLTLDHRHVETLDALLVSQGDEFTDWIAASDRQEGRTADYYLEVDPRTGQSQVYLDAQGLRPAVDYNGAVVASYQYGHEGIPGSISRATALRAAASLVADEDSNVQIPDNVNMMSVQSKADEFRQDANRLLKPYRVTPVA